MVSVVRFELTTPRVQGEYATRLRYTLMVGFVSGPRPAWFTLALVGTTPRIPTVRFPCQGSLVIHGESC